MYDKLLYIDFEYTDSNEEDLTLVAVAYKLVDRKSEVLWEGSLWLYKDAAAQCAFALWLADLLPTTKIVSYALTAETRAICTLIPHLSPTDIVGYDLYLIYKMLINHNDVLAYGSQLIKGNVTYTYKPKPKWERSEEDQAKDSSKPEAGLGSAVFKLLGVQIDSERKSRIRDIIISADPLHISTHKEEILAYAESDVEWLPKLFEAQKVELKRAGVSKDQVKLVLKTTAEYAVRTAFMERLGYPVSVRELGGFVAHTPEILNEAAGAVNEAHPEVGAFELNKKTGLFVRKTKPIVEWIKQNHDEKRWLKTDTGQPSLSIEAFGRYYKSESPGFGGAMTKYLRTKQSLNGFSPNINKKRGSFHDYVGRDGRCRPYFGIYGSQSSRSQPSATGYLPLKAHWMRYFIQPNPGRAIVGWDYASEEFLIAALLAGDEAMVDAYKTGDVYLAFGKQAGLIPEDGTKEAFKRERDTCKTLVLGVSYDMSSVGLADRLTKVTASPWTSDMADVLIQKFFKVYAKYATWKRQTLEQYHREEMLSLSDGWIMFGDNDNFRSVGNFPIQGAGAVVMRRAVALAQDAGIDVIYTLHDALYAEVDSKGVREARVLADCMVRAFEESFPGVDGARDIRLDGYQWSSDYKGKEQTVKLKCYTGSFPLELGERYIDERAEADIERYRKYFE